MRKQLYLIIEPAEELHIESKIYDIIMMTAILLSVIPLAFKESNVLFHWIDVITIGIFALDYLLRLFTADFKLEKSKASFFIYPFTPMAIIDLLSFLPALITMHSTFEVIKVARLFRLLKALRAFKFLRYFKSFTILANVLEKQKRVLETVATMAISYIFVSALIIYNVEPETFETFFDAIYWATISLTTVGYGDIHPVTTLGRLVAMLSSIFGIAIIALPSGVFAAGYLSELNKES